MKKRDPFYYKAAKLYESLQVHRHLSKESLSGDFLKGIEDLLQEQGFEVLDSHWSVSFLGNNYLVGFVLDFHGRRVSLTKDIDNFSFCGDYWQLCDHHIEDYDYDDGFGARWHVKENDVEAYNRMIEFSLEGKNVAYCPLKLAPIQTIQNDGWPVGVIFAFLRGESLDLGDPVSIRPQDFVNCEIDVA